MFRLCCCLLNADLFELWHATVSNAQQIYTNFKKNMQSKMVHFIALVRPTETFWRFMITIIVMPESTAVTQT